MSGRRRNSRRNTRWTRTMSRVSVIMSSFLVSWFAGGADHGGVAGEATVVQAGQGEVGDLAGGHRAPRPEREAPGPVPGAGRPGDQSRHPDQGPVQAAGPQQA